MTDKKDEALKLALEALNRGETKLRYEAIAAIKEALAQSQSDEEQPAQQQEPVAWMWRCKPYCDWPKWSVSLKRPADSGRDGHKRTEGYEDVPLYTSPQPSKPWVGLSTDEIYDMYNEPRSDAEMVEFARAIEAKLKERNA